MSGWAVHRGTAEENTDEIDRTARDLRNGPTRRPRTGMLSAPARLGAQAPMSYTDVTDSRLLNPEPQNWLMYRGNYAGWGYSSSIGSRPPT